MLKAAVHLLGTDVGDRAPRFIQLEQENGQSVYVPRGAIVKVCEHGTVLTHEEATVKKGNVV
jgi:hypothetical protein